MDAKAEPPSVRMSRAAILLSLVIVGLIAWATLSALARSRESARRTLCASNLNQIAKACFAFADTHADRFSNNLSELYPAHIPDLRVFQCPFHKREALTSQQIDAESDYSLTPARLMENPFNILGYCRHPHPDGTANVLIGTGTIEFTTRAELMARLKGETSTPKILGTP